MAKQKKKTKQTAVVKLVRKSNNLVEAKYKFDIWETRVFTKMISMIRPEDADFKDYRIYLSDIINDYGLKTNKEAYEWLKRGARKLTKKTIKIIRDTENGKTEFYAPIAIGVENPLDPNFKDEEMSYVDISFHPKMKSDLLALKSQFTIYDVRNVLKLPSSYSIRIYELLKQYERIGKRKFTFLGLKEIIGAMEEFEEGKKVVIKDHYPLYGNFRQRVLLKAQKDLDKYTDIKFDFEPIKRGRKVHEIQFYIIKNDKNDTRKASSLNKLKKEKPVEKKTINSEFDALFASVKEWVGERTLRKLLKDYPENQVRNAIQYTLRRIKKGDDIDNIAGHIIAMSKQTELFSAPKSSKSHKKEKQVEMATRKANLEGELKELKKYLYQREVAAIDSFLSENESERKEVFAITRQKPLFKYKEELSEAENYAQNEYFRMSVYTTVKKFYPKVVGDLQSSIQPKIDQMEKALQR